MNTTNSIGPSSDLCGIPLFTYIQSDSSPPTDTLGLLPVKKASIHRNTSPFMPSDSSLTERRLCGTESKALAKSV